MRFIATADWQLGMTAHRLDDQARPRFLQARLDAVRRIAELAHRRDAQFVLVCGDVFESNQLERGVVARAAEVLRAFTVPVVLLPGNHDCLDASSVYDSPVFAERAPEQVTVLREPGVHTIAPGLEVIAAPWSSKRPGRDLVASACAGLEPAPDGTVRVLAAHGAVASLAPDAGDPATIDDHALRAVLGRGVAHVAVLGDRHSTTRVDDRIWYPGTPEVTARREVDPGNVLVIDVDPATRAVTVDPVHVGAWTFTVLSRTLDSGGDVDALARDLDGVDAKDRMAVWLALTGTLTLAEDAHLESVLDASRDLFAHLDIWRSHSDLAVVPDDHDFSDLHLGGFADQGVAELVAQATGSDDAAAQDAQGALRLLHRLADRAAADGGAA